MTTANKDSILLLFLVIWLFNPHANAQDTQIRGFIAVDMNYQNDQLNFGFGEQDLFITSDLNDHFSFLGEAVFKYSPNSPSKYNASIERVIITYNYKGNHNILVGKHHTPINYWNDTYHHGRVFFPTIDRPLLFSEGIIPIHTTGIAFQGLNLGDMRFGYNVMLGNGLGSPDISDNDKYKSITVAGQVKPWPDWQLGVSFYRDVISSGASHRGKVFTEMVNQQLITGSVAYFGKKFELLAESTIGSNDAASTGTINSSITYVYAGVRLNDKWVPYMRYDNLSYDTDEIVFNTADVNSIVLGVRHEFNYLVVVKAEFQNMNRESVSSSNMLSMQIAIGF